MTTTCVSSSNLGLVSASPVLIALESKRAELLAHLAALRGEITVEHASEAMEAALLRALRDAVVADVNRTQIGLAMVSEAIARVRLGVYGRCAICSKPISAKRLVARPEAPDCFTCADERGAR